MSKKLRRLRHSSHQLHNRSPYPDVILDQPSWRSPASAPEPRLWPDASPVYPEACPSAAMRLRTVDPPLPDTLLDALAELNIRTDADLIFYGTPMELYRKLPLGTVTLADLAGHIERVVEYVAAAGTRGDILLEREVQHKATYDGEEFSSGVPQLDELLHGFGGSRVIEISGDRGSGKTVSHYEMTNIGLLEFLNSHWPCKW